MIRWSGPPHIYGMGYLMKTTLNIDDTVMRKLKREAARQGRINVSGTCARIQVG